jgi:hypothetical protein
MGYNVHINLTGIYNNDRLQEAKQSLENDAFKKMAISPLILGERRDGCASGGK